jgi:hypothetical protein
MTDFYHDLITEKSFQILKKIKKNLNFILIGGWAVFLYTKSLKSKDIDIIIDYKELSELKKKFTIAKNQRLLKYEIKIEGIDIDIYLPHFSKIGLPITKITENTQTIESFIVPLPEILLILKLYAWNQRKGSVKAEKDLIDIFSILQKEVIDWGRYVKIIKEYKMEDINEKLKTLVSSQKAIPELDLTNHKIAKLKKRIIEKL